MAEGDQLMAKKLRELPLRYRLSIPFFFLALIGTSSLVILAIRSQNDIIRQEENERLMGYYRALDNNIELQGRWAVSLASSFARSPEVAEALAAKDRMKLIEITYSSYDFMKKQYGISQFNFHCIPPRMFLRLQRLYEFGDDLGYRHTVVDTVARKQETFGLETGLTGHGIRGVAPVFHEGRMAGSVEIGFSFGTVFLEGLKKQFNVEVSLLSPGPDGSTFQSFATTFPRSIERSDPAYAETFRSRTPSFLFDDISDRPYAILVRAIQDYNGNTVALAEFCADRTDTLAVISHYWMLMLGIGALGLIFSVGAIYAISAYFIKPIGNMVTLAREITSGNPPAALDAHPSGELGVLADALDEMLVSLEQSNKQIKNYTDNLEQMVHIRTRALRESEEKYRTLVETIPLVVYRILGNGKIIFINRFIEDLTGFPLNQALESPEFWKEKVWEGDRERIWPIMNRCLNDGIEFKAEYRIARADNKEIFVLDHALPVLDEKGSVESVDGFLVNVTDRHRLQQQIIQTEELRSLSEISARLAHEIRNPLAAAGGFARRLLHTLSEEDPNRGKVQIIVKEVARLERILEKTLAYLRPFEIIPDRISLNDLIPAIFDQLARQMSEKSITYELNLFSALPVVPLDQTLFRKALESILQALLSLCQAGTHLRARTYPGESAVYLEILVRGVQVSGDDVDHFFYPFMSRVGANEEIDLPIAKMIIHKHRGIVDLRAKGSEQLVLSISLPQ